MQDHPWSVRQVRKALREARREDSSFATGQILGSMCTEPHAIAQEANAQFLPTNLGDPGHFPGTARLERELLEDACALLHAPKKAAARLLSGGTEANLLAMYLAREATGRKEVVLPDTAHFSFEKAARLLQMDLVHVPTQDGKADPAAMAKATTRRTALMVGVAGTTELGLVDPIDALSAAARKAKVPLHIDAAFGGYVLPFLAQATRIPHAFDFRLTGVTSISLDPHKMGLAPVPAGILVLRDGREWDRTAVRTPYVSTEAQSTLMGTRPGASAAAAWAVHRLLGRRGFASVVETCLDNTTYLAAQLQQHGVDLVAQPELNVVTFRSRDPEALAAALAGEGFRLNVVPRYQALRIVVNPHVTRPVIDRFLAALAKVGT